MAGETSHSSQCQFFLIALTRFWSLDAHFWDLNILFFLLPDTVLEEDALSELMVLTDVCIFYFPLLLVSEEGWLSRCPLDMAWCNIFLNELKGGLPPCDSAVCQAQITQWEEHQCCQFVLLSLTLAPAASVNSPRASPFPSLDTAKTSQLNIWGLVTKFNSFINDVVRELYQCLNKLFQPLKLDGVLQTTGKWLTEIEKLGLLT